MDQSGSSSKFQWERLFGSFQSIAASITARSPPAYVNLLFRVLEYLETGTPQHCFSAGAVRDPPVGLIVRILVLDEMHYRVAWLVEHFGFENRIIHFDPWKLAASPHQ